MKITAILFLLLSLSAFAAPTQIKLNKKSVGIKWVGKKFGGQHDGTIKLKSGNVIWADNDLIGGEFIIDMDSMKCTDITDKKLNKKFISHLKNGDFFETKKYPTATLTLKEARMGKGGDYEFLGNLTIKGVTKPLMFTGKMDKGEKKIKINADIPVNRTIYGITYKSKSFFNDIKEKFIEDNFLVSVAVEFKRPKTAMPKKK